MLNAHICAMHDASSPCRPYTNTTRLFLCGYMLKKMSWQLISAIGVPADHLLRLLSFLRHFLCRYMLKNGLKTHRRNRSYFIPPTRTVYAIIIITLCYSAQTSPQGFLRFALQPFLEVFVALITTTRTRLFSELCYPVHMILIKRK